MKIKANEIINNNTIPNLCLLYGSEDYLRLQFRDKIVTTLMKDNNDVNFSKFINYSGELNEGKVFFESIREKAYTVPFFANKRVILCENTGFFKNKFDGFSDFLGSIPNSTYIVFSEREINKSTSAYKTVNNTGFVEEYTMPDIYDLNAWVKHNVKTAGLNIENDALREFVSITKLNMNNMSMELDKLISYCINKEIITKEDVNIICTANYEEQIFNIINAIADKDKKRALSEYSLLYKLQTDPRRIFYHLTSSFSLILKVKKAIDAKMSKNQIMNNLNIKKDYAFSKNSQAAAKFSYENLMNILDLSMEYQKKLNTGLLEKQTGIEMFIISALNS